MTPDIAAYGVTIAALVSALLGTLVKPLIEALPFANPARPAAYNGAAHDALLRGANVLLNVTGVLLLASMHNQVSLSNWLSIALETVVQALGSHALYQAVKPTAPAAVPVVVSNAAVAQALNTAISQSERAAAAPASQGQPNAVKQLADDAAPDVAAPVAASQSASASS